MHNETSLIPLASTISKSLLHWPRTPVLTRGKGGIVWDTEGKSYIDFVSALCPVILGYCDPDVDDAIRAQLERGISFSFATPLEEELAALLNRLVPCAEMVRFGKNGSDVTAAAVRLARYHTSREWVIYTGYHGWHDWSIRHKAVAGIPWHKSVFFSTESAIDKIDDETAAVVVDGDAEDLPALRRVCDHYGAVLIFDEIVTGFRVNLGGAQKEHGIVPDLSCFGKAMGNGMPISALVGKREIMQKMEDVFYSGTFMGETLSLAAAIACIKKLERLDVPSKLKEIGARLLTRPGVSGPSWRPKWDRDSREERGRLLDAGIILGSHFNLQLGHEHVTW